MRNSETRQRRLTCSSVRYQDSSVLKLYLVSSFWDRLRLDSAVDATDGVLVLEEYSAILPFPAPPFSFLCGRTPLTSSLLSYPPLPSPRFDQSLESSRLRGTPNVTAISRSVPEEDGCNVEHDCQTRNSLLVVRCFSNQYEKRRLNIGFHILIRAYFSHVCTFKKIFEYFLYCNNVVIVFELIENYLVIICMTNDRI